MTQIASLFSFDFRSSKLSSFQCSINTAQYEKMFLLVSLMNEKCEDQVVSSNDNFVKMETDQTVVHGK